MPWAPDYATADELALYARILDHVDDAQLQLAVSTASRAIDLATNRQFGQVGNAELRPYYARVDYGTGWWTVDVDDYQDPAGIIVEVVDAGTVATYDKAPLSADKKGRPWTRIEFTVNSEQMPTVRPYKVNVTAKWGWSAVPAAIKEATLLQASRLFARRNAPFGVAGSPDSGSEMRLLAKLDPDVAVAVADYRRAGRLG